MTMLPTPRDPYPNESMVWNRLKQRFDVLTKRVLALLSTAEVSANFQYWLSQNNTSLSCFDESDQRVIDEILNRYNTLGRLIYGAETGKYHIQIRNGDVTIGAPPGMSDDVYSADLYPGAMDEQVGLGAPLLIVGLITVALVTGAIIAVEALDYSTKSKDHEFRKNVIDADKAMMAKPKDIRDSWIKMKKESSGLIDKANTQHGSNWFESLGIGGAAGLVVLILGLIVATQISKR